MVPGLRRPGSQPLTPGTYENATRYPFNGAGPGLSLHGNGRGCNELTGTFTVLNAVFGPNGYVQTFDATFEQHGEGGTAAARGEAHIANPPAPAPLDLALAVATHGTASTVSGKAIVHGTVTCNQPTSVALYGTVTEIAKKTIVRGDFTTRVDCLPGSIGAAGPATVRRSSVPELAEPGKALSPGRERSPQRDDPRRGETGVVGWFGSGGVEPNRLSGYGGCNRRGPPAATGRELPSRGQACRSRPLYVEWCSLHAKLISCACM
ncbi:hypothetical protein [Micromonospora schwarzwaldensis]|uniref:hypothetical protein n=1 Tax=Micromonospora sp. DSM 45708 TaxID=3111767 RepID=UPI0031DC5B76